MFAYDYNIARSIVAHRVEEALREAEIGRLIQSIHRPKTARKRLPLAIPNLKRLLAADIGQEARIYRCEESNGDLANCPAC